MPTYLKTEKMKVKLGDEGLLYLEDRAGPLKTHWCCMNYQKRRYRARISVSLQNTKERRAKSLRQFGEK